MAFFPVGFDIGYRFCMPPEHELRALQMTQLNQLNDFRHAGPSPPVPGPHPPHHALYGPDKLARRGTAIPTSALSVDTSLLPLNMCKKRSPSEPCISTPLNRSPHELTLKRNPLHILEAGERPPVSVSLPLPFPKEEDVDVEEEGEEEVATPPKPFKFSIDDILSRKDPDPRDSAGSSRRSCSDSMDGDFSDGGQMAGLDFMDEHEVGQLPSDGASRFSWLQCTRYKPPKLPRSKKKDGLKKRKLGRNPRVPFTQHQVGVLEQKFRHTHYLSSVDVAELSAALNLTETRVKIWFQNRRARERRDKESGTHTHGKLSSTSTSSSTHGMPGHHVVSTSSPGVTSALPALPWGVPAKPGSMPQFPGRHNHRGSAFSSVSLCSFC